METISNLVSIIFGLGLFLNSLLFIPQIICLYKNKHANDTSIVTFAGFNLMNLFGILHGLVMHDMILVVGYGVSFITNTIVTMLIIKYKYFSPKPLIECN